MVRVPTDISEGGISDYKSDYVVGEIEIPPVKTRGEIYFVETRGIDVPSKDGGCRGSICIFRL
jgi:hypothetical protein